MNLAILGGLGLIGSYIINNTRNDKNDPIVSPATKTDTIDNTGLEIKKKIDNIESNENDSNLTYNNGYKNSNMVKLFPTDINSKVHHIYDMRSVPKLRDKFYDMASDQRERSKIPERTNIIPSYFNQPYRLREKDQAMGPVPTTELLNVNNETYVTQFNLQSVDNPGEPISRGDGWKDNNNRLIFDLGKSLSASKDFSPFDTTTNDMTYGITDKEYFTHNNMQPFIAKRDLGITEKNNFEYPMEIFTGSSKNWNPKRETIPFFDPEEYKGTPFQTPIVVDEERDRIITSRIRQNERPFEPVLVGPGLNLDYDQPSTHGFHDPLRVMPKDTNELRTQNKPKIEYENRVQAPPRKGGKRGVIASVVKRRPEQWRHQTVDDLVPNRAINTAQADPGNYIIPDNARRETTSYQMDGPAVAPFQVGGDERAGKVKISKRVTHVEDKLGPKTTDRYTTNPDSYNILMTQRNTTNYDDRLPAKNVNQGGVSLDPNDLAKTTKKQSLTKRQFNNMMGQIIGTYTDLSDEARSTIKQIITTQTYNQIVTGAQHNVYANLSDDARKTLKQILTLCEFNNSTKQNPGTYASPQDIANKTLREITSMLEYNTHVGTSHIETYANLNDEAKTTGRQILTTKEFNNVVRQLITSYANLSDDARTTIRQTLTNSEFNTNIGSAQKDVYSNLSDEARTTLRQILSMNEFNTDLGYGQKNSYANLSDVMRTTLREILSVLEVNNNVGSARKNVYANLSDLAKTTLRQIMSTLEFNTATGVAQRENYVNLTDQMRTTIRELLTLLEHNTNVGSAQKNPYSNLGDLARTTTRETLTKSEFNTFLSRTMNSYANLSDEAKTTLKQLLTSLQLNTIIKTAQKESYTELQDDIRTTLKQLLTLETFSTFMKENIGTYADLPDDARTTIRELLVLLENNNNMKSAQRGTYANLMDLAKTTIKEFIAESELNNNIGTIRKEIAVDHNDIARITHKQDLLNENYVSALINSSSGVPQVSFDIAPTMKDITKVIDYKSSGYAVGVNRKPEPQMAERNMRQNTAKEIIAQGVYPTLSGPKLIPTKDNYNSMRQNNKPNYNRANPPTLLTKTNLEDRQIFRGQHIRRKVNYDERLYDELLAQFNDNPLVNNVQTTARSTFNKN